GSERSLLRPRRGLGGPDAEAVQDPDRALRVHGAVVISQPRHELGYLAGLLVGSAVPGLAGRPSRGRGVALRSQRVVAGDDLVEQVLGTCDGLEPQPACRRLLLGELE